MLTESVPSFLLHHISICILLLVLSPVLHQKMTTTHSFEIAFDEVYRISQDFIIFSEGNASFEQVPSHFPRYSHLQPPVPSCTVSLLDGEIQSAFRTCYFSNTSTNLIVYASSAQQFMGVLQSISRYGGSYKENRRHSYCQIFILIQSCLESISELVDSVFDRIANSDSSLPHSFPFDVQSDVYVGSPCTQNRALEQREDEVLYRIWEMYSVKGNLFTQLVSTQTNVFNFTELWLNTKPKVDRRHNLHLVPVTASAYIDVVDENDNKYEVEVGTGGDGETVFLSGMSVSIFQDFKHALNFTGKALKIYFNIENYFETSFVSGEYQFDINLYHLGVTQNRTKVAQPLHPTFFDGVHAIFIQPVSQSVRNIYRKPFALDMWQSLLVAWTIIFVCCKLFVYVQVRFMPVPHVPIRQDKPMDTDQDEISDSVEDGGGGEQVNDTLESQYCLTDSSFESLLWCVATVCQQGWYKVPTSTSFRWLLLTGLLLSVLTYIAYTGKIVADLWDISKPIKTLKALMTNTDAIYLLTSSDTSFDVLEGLSNDDRAEELLRKIRFSSLDKVYSALQGNPGKACVITWTDFMANYVRERLGANNNITDSMTGQAKAADAYICDTLSSFSFQATSSLFVPQDSELTHLFNYRIVVGLERGFIRRYWKTYKKHTTLSCVRNNPKMTTLDLGDVYFAFLIVLSGMTLSISLFITEAMAHQLYFRIQTCA